MYTKAARWVCDGLILETSVIGLLLVLFDSGCVDHEARQSFNDDPFLLVAELLPQARLRDGNVEEVEIQLRHGLSWAGSDVTGRSATPRRRPSTKLRRCS